MEPYIKAMKNYVTFSGRSSRQDYWMFQLFVFLFTLAACVVDGVLTGAWGGGLVYVVTALAHFLPGLAAAARRLHDTDKSAWWLLLLLIPLVGPIVILVFLCLPSQPGGNRFGGNPYGR